MKRDVIYIPVIIILLLGGFLIFDRYAKIKDDHESLNGIIDIQNQEILSYQDKEGKWVAEKQVIQLTAKQLKNNADLLGIDNRSLVKKVGRLSRLVSHLDAQLEARGEGSTELRDSVIVLSDSLGQKPQNVPIRTFDWSNSYLSLNGTIIDNTLDFDYSYNSSFKITTYNKKEGIFSKKKLVADITFDDPGAQTMSMKAINIKPPVKKFYQKWWFHTGIGFAGGLLLMK